MHAEARPRIGLLGITQELYDDMIPGITERQALYSQRVAHFLRDVVDVRVGPPVKSTSDAERVLHDFENAGLDGLLVVMLTYGPAMRVARQLSETKLPVCLANIQPERSVTPAWGMAEMTYNQGIHGAQDTANALVAAKRHFHVITEDWESENFRQRVSRWARAAATLRAWQSLRIGLVGYPMNGMGDIRVDENFLLSELGPQVLHVAPGELYREMNEIFGEKVRELLSWEDEHFQVDPALSAEERADHARMQLGLEAVLTGLGCGAYTAHFGAIAEDGRFNRLPIAAASSLMAKGYGYAAEGDILNAAMVFAGHRLFGDANFTEMYAMDFAKDSALMSHMGEGNWRVARADEPVRLIKRPLGIGKLNDPPTFLFRLQPGPATLATLTCPGSRRFRMVVAEGDILDSEPMPGLEMPYGHFRPASGLRTCLDSWLLAGGPHHQVMTLGRHAADWQLLCEMAGIEYCPA